MSPNKPDDRAEEMLLDLPFPSPELGPTVHVREAGAICVIGSVLPHSEGRLYNKGRLGLELRLDQGQAAARVAMIMALAMIKAHFGTLNTVKHVVQLTGYIAAGPDFHEHHQVLDHASTLLVDLFGTAGKHTRTPIGVSSLPGGSCVMLELQLLLK